MLILKGLALILVVVIAVLGIYIMVDESKED